MTPDELKAIEERAAKAKDYAIGKHFSGSHGTHPTISNWIMDCPEWFIIPDGPHSRPEVLEAVCDFYDSAGEDIKALVAEVRRLQEELAGVAETAAEIRQTYDRLVMTLRDPW